jgi:3'-5' exoribonuclease
MEKRVYIGDIMKGYNIRSHHGPHGDIMPRTTEAWAVHIADHASAQLREVADDITAIRPGEMAKGTRCGGPVYRFPLRDE